MNSFFKKIIISLGCVALILSSAPVSAQSVYPYLVTFSVSEFTPDVVIIADGHTLRLGDLYPGEYSREVILTSPFSEEIIVEIRTGGRLLGEVQPVVVIPNIISSQYTFKSQFGAKENPNGTLSITNSSSELTFKSGGLKPAVYSLQPSVSDIALAPELSENARQKLLQIPSVFRINGSADKTLLFVNGLALDVLKTNIDTLDAFYKKEGLTNFGDATKFESNIITDSFTNLTKYDSARTLIVKLENDLPGLYLFNVDGSLRQTFKSSRNNFYLAYGTVLKDGVKTLAIVVSSSEITKNNFVAATGGALVASENPESRLFSPGWLEVGESTSVLSGLNIVNVSLAQGITVGPVFFEEEVEGEATPPPQSQDNLIDPPCTEVTAGETTTEGIPGVTTTGGETKKKGKTTGFGVSGSATLTQELGTIGEGKSKTTVSGFVTVEGGEGSSFTAGFQFGKGGEPNTVTTMPDGGTVTYGDKQDAMDAVDEYLREKSKSSCPPPATPPPVEEESLFERLRKAFTSSGDTTPDDEFLRSPEPLVQPLIIGTYNNYSGYSAPTLYEQTTSFLQTTSFFNFLR